MKKYVYLIVIHKIKCIYAKKPRFQAGKWDQYNSLFLQNYPMDNFDRINEFVVLYEIEKQ